MYSKVSGIKCRHCTHSKMKTHYLLSVFLVVSIRHFGLTEGSVLKVRNIEHLEEVEADAAPRRYDVLKGKPMTRNGLIDEERRWSRTIAMRFSSSLPLQAIGTILEAVEDLELKTCFRFVQGTVEFDYLNFISGDGCYSYVGRQGGPQTISIGRGCENIAIVQHEIVHALGFLHEQSRTDRDDYVRINLSNVQSGNEHNFDDYDENVIHSHRVPYDYYSLMHYHSNAFSKNGLTTITTNNLYFQNIIGTTTTLSHGDLTKIERMYNCGDTTRYSYLCDFENPAICGYVLTSSVGWKYHEISESHGSLPQTDGSYGEFNKGSVVLAQRTSGSLNSAMILRTPLYETTFNKQCLEFSYFMSSQNPTLRVTLEETNCNNTVTTSLLSIAGSGVGNWETMRTTLSSTSNYTLSFTAELNEGDFVAIDDVSLVDRACDTASVYIRNFTQVLSNTPKGDWLQSDIIYTEDGYAFRILVYPNGHRNAQSGYMSIFIQLVEGVNDETLQWPFSNRFIKFSIVDQSSEVFNRQNFFRNFVTDSEDSAWDKPTPGATRGLGYHNFMKTEDIVSKWYYLKHGNVILSVQVKDLNDRASISRTNANQLKQECESTASESVTTSTNSVNTNANSATTSAGDSKYNQGLSLTYYLMCMHFVYIQFIRGFLY